MSRSVCLAYPQMTVNAVMHPCKPMLTPGNDWVVIVLLVLFRTSGVADDGSYLSDAALLCLILLPNLSWIAQCKCEWSCRCALHKVVLSSLYGKEHDSKASKATV